MEIQSGRRLEVLWEIGSAPRRNNVWWGSVVCTAEVPRLSAPVSATIRYDALHGFEEADSKVTFVSKDLLEQVEEGKKPARHPWRWATTDDGGSLGEGTISGSVGGACSTEKGGAVTTIYDTGNVCSDPKGGSTSDLPRLVLRLERQVRILKTHSRPSEPSVGLMCGRTLFFARHKLGVELDKPFPGTISSLGKYRDAHTVSQSLLSVQVDCTLHEFEDISKLTTSQAKHGIRVHPRVPVSNSCHAWQRYMYRRHTA